MTSGIEMGILSMISYVTNSTPEHKHIPVYHLFIKAAKTPYSSKSKSQAQVRRKDRTYHGLEIHAHQKALQYAQEFRNKSFQMKDDFAPEVDPMFVKGGPFDDVRLEGVVNLVDQAERQQLEDHSGGDAVREQVVELGTDSEDPAVV